MSFTQLSIPFIISNLFFVVQQLLGVYLFMINIIQGFINSIGKKMELKRERYELKSHLRGYRLLFQICAVPCYHRTNYQVSRDKTPTKNYKLKEIAS